jgi:hypothetical protein
MSKKNGFKYPKTIHVINLGTKSEPDFILSEDPKTLLGDDEWEHIATYELANTSKMRLTSTVETE